MKFIFKWWLKRKMRQYRMAPDWLRFKERSQDWPSEVKMRLRPNYLWNARIWVNNNF